MNVIFDPEINPSASQTMKAILMAVVRGSHLYTTVSVPADKALSVVTKWHERYGLILNNDQRYYRRKKKQAVFSLFIYPERFSKNVTLFLLRTEGEHPLLNLETWRDATVKQSRLQWLHSYELVKMPVPVEHRKKLQGKKKRRIPSVGWTWRMTETALKEKRALIRRQVSGKEDDRLRQMIFSLSGVPGFRGNRVDVKALHLYIEGQCKKHKKPCPDFPTIPWIRAKSSATVPFSLILHRAAKCRPTWFPANIKGKSNLELADPVADAIKNSEPR